MLYGKKIVTALCLAQALSLTNAAESNKTGIPSSDELAQISESFMDRDKLRSNFYIDLAMIANYIETNDWNSAIEGYIELLKQFSTHNSPDENLMKAIKKVLNPYMIAERINTFTKENKQLKDADISQLMNYLYIINDSLSKNNFEGLKNIFLPVKELVRNYINTSIQKSPAFKTDQDTNSIFSGSKATLDGLEENRLPQAEQYITMVRGVLSSQNTLTPQDASSARTILTLLELMLDINDIISSQKLEQENIKPQDIRNEQKEAEDEMRREQDEEANKARIRADEESAQEQIQQQRQHDVRFADSHYKRIITDFGLPETATFAEVKKQYRKYALELHPDKLKNIAPEEAAAKMEQWNKIQTLYHRLEAHFREGVYAGM